jgi:calcineurin-like phosphoesterase family protein
VWVVSDTHFRHENIIEYCDRPFKNVNDMNSYMIARWNSVVKDDDIVWHLGDFGFGGKEVLSYIFSTLRGQKRLILGNHDSRCGGVNFWESVGFEYVSRFPVCVMRVIWLSHAPIFLDDNSAYINIHGHTHNHDLETDSRHWKNVSVEVVDYTPVRLDLIMKSLGSDFSVKKLNAWYDDRKKHSDVLADGS